MNDLITDNSQIMFVDDGRKDKTRKFNEDIQNQITIY